MTNEANGDGIQHYPLANDANGNQLVVPVEAVAWRVRKLARRAGRPKVLFDAETGRPLEVAIDVTYEDFCSQVNESGRFRLEAVDGQGRIIVGCVAVTEVVLDDEDEETALPRNAAESLPHLHQLIAHLVDANTQVMKAMASAFGNVQPVRNASRVELPVVSSGGPDAGSQVIDTINQIGSSINQLVGTFMAHKNGFAGMTSPPMATPTPTKVV